MVIAKAWVLKKHFDGLPKTSDFDLKKIELPNLKDGGKILRIVLQESQSDCIGNEPAAERPRGWSQPYSQRQMKEGDIMIGTQVARIVESKNPAFTVGAFVVGEKGWRTHFISDGKDLQLLPANWLESLPKSLALGTVGMPGALCADSHDFQRASNGRVYCELMEQPPEGRSAGPAKVGRGAYPCYGDENHIVKCLHHHDVKMENCRLVGGEFASVAINQMKKYGRIAVCGAISQYNDSVPQKGEGLYCVKIDFLFGDGKKILQKSTVYFPVPFECILQLLIKLLRNGKVKYHEHVTEGFENMPMAFIGMLKGENLGKAVV
ncbi:hypothetical protein IHE44_0011221, partial [Lamprotornis superbus]